MPPLAAGHPHARTRSSVARAARATLAALLACATLLASHGLCQAKTFYVDAKAGADSNDGSAARPWRSLQRLFDAKLVESRNWSSLPYSSSSKLTARNAGAPVKAGDTILLRSGTYGAVSISGYYNASPITIAAAPGATPKLSQLTIRSSERWVVRGLHVSPSFATSYSKAQMVSVASHGHSGPARDVTVQGLTVFSVPDVSKWSAADWNNKAANGISASGTNITIRGNVVRNVNFGISVGASKSLVIGNLVENFAGDGLRGLGDYTVFENNTVRNCYDVNANHDDGFQSWSRGSDGKVGTGAVTGVVLRGNRIINYTDPNQPFRCTLQGIGLFDGMFVDWVIENNVIITDHWHGISVYGAKNVKIVNNTVLDPNSARPGPPWIKITNHKNGTKPSGCLVRNNLATAFASVSTGVTEDHNIKITDPAKLFVDAAGYDVRPRAGSAAVDKGTATGAPAKDIVGTARPQGSGVDVGAYEHTTKPPPVADSGAPAADSGAGGSGSSPDAGVVGSVDGGSGGSGGGSGSGSGGSGGGSGSGGSGGSGGGASGSGGASGDALAGGAGDGGASPGWSTDAGINGAGANGGDAQGGCAVGGGGLGGTATGLLVGLGLLALVGRQRRCGTRR